MTKRMQRPPKEWVRVPAKAWPSLCLFFAMGLLWIAGVAAGVSGKAPLAVVVVAITLADYVAFTLMHEASHGLFGRRQRLLNQVAGEVCATMLMCRFNGFRQVHLRHHRHACDPEQDPDTWAGEGPWWQLPLRWATSDLHYWMVYDRSIKLPTMERRVSRVTLVLWLGALGAALATGHGLDVLLLYVLPARIALFVSTYFFDFLPHQRPHGVPTQVAPHQSAVVVRAGALLDALLLGHTLHLVHHLHPSVPWYRLRRVYRHQRAGLLAAGSREVSVFSLPRPFEEDGASTPCMAESPG